MKTLRPIVILSLLLTILLGTARPAAAATITFTSDPPPSPATIQQRYPTHTFTATGDETIRFALASGTLPPGMTLSAAGVFSGVPTVLGSYSFTVRATGAPSGDFADQSVTVEVFAPVITFTSELPAARVVGSEPYPVHFFYATGGSGPYDFSIASGDPPPFLTLSGSGMLSGTPARAGTFTFVVRATDRFGFFAEQTVTIEVVAPVLVPTFVPPSPWYIGGTYSGYRIEASGASGPFMVRVLSGDVPPGMTVGPAGDILGGPEEPGTYTFVVRITDGSGGFHVDQSITIVAVLPNAVITSGEPPRGKVDESYSFTFTATGDRKFRFSVSDGDLPEGLTLRTDGLLSGTPEEAGSFTFTVTAAGDVTSDTQEVTLVVDPLTSPSPTPTPTPTATPTPTPTATTAPPSDLAVTGSDLGASVLLALVLIGAGGILVVLGRVRRSRSELDA
ncbi:putative Ig domain-containing protein [Plantactinospora solaniradicis]|uniref:Ig domain-containing protein n=1 Tax=Plantactinospora solaniradicis TaxID=1723736 RepID=A0ABW1KLQ4_9ACTN